ncbi:hypothetical protein M413DRAFT_440380 [Hebeloma cylindrosporum]|uniref:Uncharacterized protein n=1 Tax=Hebeloma cylindrosporum TaxID=76867 RepID=A0A0C2YAE7_HEBCY|nr:hypothetical protein M413DRAFT_440380 [Hebeloma cylindrosporum h7]
MAELEVSSGLNAASSCSNVPKVESTPVGNTFNEPHPGVEDTEGEQPPKEPRPLFMFSHVSGFPRLISQRKPSLPDKIFASALFAAGHGYPLFYPDTIAELDDDFRRTRGISLGDVGVLSPENQFIFAFNIFLPADHPYNKSKDSATPESFVPLSPLEDSEICTTVDYFPPGYVIASKGVNVVRHSEDPLHITFSSSERRGACMVLPKGATRHDISSTRVVQYVKNNAVSWARDLASRDIGTPNGSLYIVRGVDKTSVCENLAFPSRPPSVKMSATFQNGDLRPMERMSVARGANAENTLTPIPNNLCVFMRGIRVGLGRSEWVASADERIEAHTGYTEMFTDTFRIRLPFLKTGFWRIDEQAISMGDKPLFVREAFHPSDIAAQIMLCLDPNDPTAALVYDSIWSISHAVPDRNPEVQQDPLTLICSRGCSFDDVCSMFDDVFSSYEVMKSRGVLTLKRIQNPEVERDPWHIKLWRWLSGNQRIRGGTLVKQLFHQGQFHFKTNHALR